MDRFAWITDKVNDLRRRPYGPPTRDPRLKRRAILKNGEYNILPPKFSGRYLHYVKDTFTGLVDAEWKWTLQVMVIGFVGCWLVFALIWWLIAFVHADLQEDHLPAMQPETGWTPCVLNIHGFYSCFLYSLETQHTTGYGLRAITEECPEAIFIMCAQCIIGMIIDSFTVGVVFAKLTRPRLTTYTVQFSRNAVICLRDEQLCLMFRVGDLRKSRLIGVSIRAILIQTKRTKEGETLKYYESDLDIECDSCGSDLFFIWPVTVVHKINEDSPFYHLSAEDMLQRKFEVVVMLDATIESTGQSTNAKTSYLYNEILWGHRFETMVVFNDEHQCYEANYGNFDRVLRVGIPMCSAADLEAKSHSNNDQYICEEKPCRKVTKQSLECHSPPNQTRTNSGRPATKILSSDQNRSATSKVAPSQVPSRLKVPTTDAHWDNCSPEIAQVQHEDYPSRKVVNEFGRRLRPRMGKSEYRKPSQYTHYESIPEVEERSDTPPFPVSWV